MIRLCTTKEEDYLAFLVQPAKLTIAESTNAQGDAGNVLKQQALPATIFGRDRMAWQV